MNFFDQFAVDEGKVANGVWFKHGEAKFLIASAEKKEYEKEITQIVIDLNQNKIDEEKSVKKINRAMAKHIVLDWKLSEDDEGPSYSEDKAYEMLSQYHHFASWVRSKASVYKNFQPTKEEVEELGN